MVVSVFIMLMGVAVFSWIMGEMGIAMHSSNGEDNFVKQRDLDIWLLRCQRFGGRLSHN